jgi:hypothetical protein
MEAFTFRLEPADGTAADPPTFCSSPSTSWNAGDTIHLGSKRSLRVLDKRLDEDLDGDPVPVLVVEDLPGSATSAAG